MANNFFMQMFARSPVRPMQQHIEKAQACATQLLPFLDALLMHGPESLAWHGESHRDTRAPSPSGKGPG